MVEKGKFIVIEGIDGGGKTTQLRLAAGYIFGVDKKHKVLMTREPTDSQYGREIRRLAADPTYTRDPEREVELFVKDRFFHIRNHVKPALNKGQQVLCDRHKMSTLAYQSAAGYDLEELFRKHESLDVTPDLTIVLDLDVNTALSRIRLATGSKGDNFEGRSYLQEVRKNFKTVTDRLRDKGENIVYINGNRSLDEVAKSVKIELNVLYGIKQAA